MKNIYHIRLIRHKVRKHCKGIITVYTDDYSIYNGLKKLIKVKNHKNITHSLYLYADGDTHVNNCKNRHSLLRTFLNMYKGVSKKYLNDYVKFFPFVISN